MNPEEIKVGMKYYLEVEILYQADNCSYWVKLPDHPYNEYDETCVFFTDLIPIKKQQAYDRKEHP